LRRGWWVARGRGGGTGAFWALMGDNCLTHARGLIGCLVPFGQENWYGDVRTEVIRGWSSSQERRQPRRRACVDATPSCCIVPWFPSSAESHNWCSEPRDERTPDMLTPNERGPNCPSPFFGVVTSLGLKSWTWSEMLVCSKDGSHVPEFGAGECSLLLYVI